MWMQILFWLVTTYVGHMLAPKPKSPKPGKLDVPSTEEGTPIPVLFGSAWLNGPIIVWWGDVKTKKIKSKGGKK